MRPKLAVVVASLVAGLFSLVPLAVQVASTLAQRRDRMPRLNHLRAELEFLERLHDLQVKVLATDEAPKPQTDHAIAHSLSRLSNEYNRLSKIPLPAVISARKSSEPQLSALRRAFLLYTPRTSAGWILHTLFYLLASIVPLTVVGLLPSTFSGVFPASDYPLLLVLFTPVYIALLIVRRLARRNAARSAVQLGEPPA